MAQEEDRRLPSGMAGISNYTDVNPEKVRLKPEHVVAVIALAVLIEVALYLLVRPF